MSKRSGIFCDHCNTMVSKGLIFKELIKPYVVLPAYNHLVCFDYGGFFKTGHSLREDIHLCIDCYNSLLDEVLAKKADEKEED